MKLPVQAAALMRRFGRTGRCAVRFDEAIDQWRQRLNFTVPSCTWHMENHPFCWRRIRRVRRIQVCMARKGLIVVPVRLSDYFALVVSRVNSYLVGELPFFSLFFSSQAHTCRCISILCSYWEHVSHVQLQHTITGVPRTKYLRHQLDWAIRPDHSNRTVEVYLCSGSDKLDDFTGQSWW